MLCHTESSNVQSGNIQVHIIHKLFIFNIIIDLKLIKLSSKPRKQISIAKDHYQATLNKTFEATLNKTFEYYQENAYKVVNIFISILLDLVVKPEERVP